MAISQMTEPALEAKLKRLRLRLERTDQDTLVIRRVPAYRRCFNKARTNLLIRRVTSNTLCVICVDEDLEYTGSDRGLAAAFAAGTLQQGWRVLTFGGGLRGDLTTALNYALGFLLDWDANTDATSPAVPAPPKRLLSLWAENLTDAIGSSHLSPTLYRDEEVEHVAACTLSWQGHLPLVLGERGTGKTNLLYGVSSALAKRGHNVLAVNIGSMMSGTLFESEREVLLASLLREAKEPGLILALEQAEWALVGVPHGPVILRDALDRGVRLIATPSTPDHAGQFNTGPLASRLEIVQLHELCAADTQRILEMLRPRITSHHGVQINEVVEQEVVERSRSMEGSLPGKAVALLDLAAARASVTGSTAVSLVDVYLVASRKQLGGPSG